MDTFLVCLFFFNGDRFYDFLIVSLADKVCLNREDLPPIEKGYRNNFKYWDR